MFGGVAQTYCRWEMDGEPYKRGKVYYAQMIHPTTHKPKEVRFYTDKKHAELMPFAPDEFGPFYKVFGFESEADQIIAIKRRDITTSEEAEHFNGNWRFGMFFGGIWYTPKNTPKPPVKNQSKFFEIDWDSFKVEGQKLSKKYNPNPEYESIWLKA